MDGSSIVTDLKWRTGFGWGVVAVLGISAAGFILAGGVLRWISLLVVLVATADMIFQYKKWNTHGWRKVHFRAMLAYARSRPVTRKPNSRQAFTRLKGRPSRCARRHTGF